MMEMKDRVPEWLQRRVEIDSRSLAVFRVLVGVLVVADVLSRSRDLVFFYTGDGVVPESLLSESGLDATFSAFTLLPDSTWAVALVFVIHAVVGLQLILGYRSRLAMLLTLFFVVSIDMRNPFVLSNADFLFAVMLFWAVFLPIGERWSVDAVIRDRDPRRSVSSLAGGFALLQMVLMYLVNGVHKTHSELWWSGEAVVVVANLDEITFLLGDYIRLLPDVALRAGGVFWFLMMLAAPLLLLLVGRRRALLALVYASGHLGLALGFRIGAFSFVAIAGLTLFLQPEFWSEVGNLSRKTGLYEKTEWFRSRAIDFANMFPQTEVASGVRESYGGAIALAVLIVVAVSGFSMVATNVGHSAASLGYGGDDGLTEISPIQDLKSGFGVDQSNWTIFAPDPKTVENYYVVAADTGDGELRDLYSDRSLSYDRPHQQLQRQYDSYRHRFYMNHVAVEDSLADLYVSHLCSTMDADTATLYQVQERLTEDGAYISSRPRNVRPINQHGCDGREPVLLEPPSLGEFEGQSHVTPVDRSTVDEHLDLPEVPEDVVCTDRPDPFTAVELRMYGKQVGTAVRPPLRSTDLEHDTRTPLNVRSVSMRVEQIAEFENAVAVRYEGRAYPRDTERHSPAVYDFRYLFTDNGAYRVVSDGTPDVSTATAEQETGYVRCFR